MSKPAIITGLDIGSSRIAAVTGQIDKDGAFNILAHVTHPSRGVSRGVIVDLNEAVDSVSRALTRIHERGARRPGDIYVNISGQNVEGVISKGMIPLSLRGREVTKMDMDRCVNAASTIHLPFDREIVHGIVHNFSIDDQSWIKNPLGLYASRLSCEVYIITADSNQIQNIYKCVNDAGYDVKEILFTGIADESSLLSKDEKNEGALLLDIGASITEASVFFAGSIYDFAIIPIGAMDIKGDLKDSVELNSLVSIINSKVDVFLKTGGRIALIVLSGGLSFVDGIIEFLEGRLSHPVKMGIAKDVRGDISGLDSVRLSTAIGLCKYGCEKKEKKAAEEKGLLKRISTKVVDIFNNYF